MSRRGPHLADYDASALAWGQVGTTMLVFPADLPDIPTTRTGAGGWIILVPVVLAWGPTGRELTCAGMDSL